jgi:hypothetical protein
MRNGIIGIVLATLAWADPSIALAQSHDTLPFTVGERLTYRVRVPKMHASGRGAMWIEGPVDVRGTAAYLLRFDMKAGLGPFKGVDRTQSWLDRDRMMSLRYAKHESHPLSRHHEEVELFPDEGRWDAGRGGSGESATDAPLDELSFLYFVRTLPLVPDTAFEFSRHFDAERNPTTVRVVGRETLTTDAGVFETIVVEMRVKHPRRYKGEGIIRIHLTDDRCRLPVRIESAMPVVGTTVLTLESHTHARGHCLTTGG